MNAGPQRAVSAADVAAALNRQAEALARQLLPAGRRQGGYWKAGGVDGAPGGSLALHLHGPRAGRWTDFATGEHGDALDLVAATLFRGDKREAWRWGLRWLGLGTDSPAPAPVSPPAPTRAVEAEDAGRRAAALGVLLAARPDLAGTPAAHYLAGRGIDLAELGRQPRALRFHPGLREPQTRDLWPALVGAITDLSGETIGVHRTWLARGRDGRWGKAPVARPKMSLGFVMGGAIRLWRGASGKPLRDAPDGEVVVIGEGIETCLSIALACPELRVLCAVSLVNLGRVALPEQVRRVILAADNDEKPGARAGFLRALEEMAKTGREVRVARSPVGKDFNDCLQGAV